MADRTTFFIIDRKLLNDPIWLNEPFTYGQAWVDLIGRANYADKSHFYKGFYQEVKRGQVLTSVLELSTRWHWGRTRTSNFLNILEKAKMITQKRTSNGTTITIENYRVYQDLRTTNDTTDEQQTSNGRTTDRIHNNQVNKGNQVNNISPERPTREVVASYISSLGFNVDPNKFYDYYEESDWTDSKGKPIRDWKRLVRAWDNNKPIVYEAKPKLTPMDKILAEMKAKREQEAVINDD